MAADDRIPRKRRAGLIASLRLLHPCHPLGRSADQLRETRKAPAILIGHSLGGAAILAAAGQIAEAKAVVTIAAPSDPSHVTGLFKDHVENIRAQGEAKVSLAGRPFTIKRE